MPSTREQGEAWQKERKYLKRSVFNALACLHYPLLFLPPLHVVWREKVNPFGGTVISASAICVGYLGALPIFLASVLLEKSGVEFFRKIDQDTKLYVVQVFGAERNWPVGLFCDVW